MQFDTVRPEVAELLYKLKYRSDQTAVQSIIDTAANFLKPHRGVTDAERDAVDGDAPLTNGTDADGQVVWS